MCGIIGIFDNNESVKLAKAGLQILKNRGKDGFGLYYNNKTHFNKGLTKLKTVKADNCIGHCLHSVVNYVEQPIKGKGTLAVNCEIYNWKYLNLKYNLKADNDAELLLRLLDRKGIKALEELDGVYAFAYWTDNLVYIARDIIGVKPLWYTKKPFTFASEKKALHKDAQELNPREILLYNTKTKTLKKTKRNFFKTIPEHKQSLKTLQEELKTLLLQSVKKRIPQKKFGILFSGGIDSTLIAFICKQMNLDFTCYTAVLEESGMEPAKDLIYARKIAKEYGFKLKVKKLNLKEVESYLKTVVPLIEDSNVVKVGVGLTMFAACQEAKKDNVKVIFSGLGSEELFAGYERHKKTVHGNKECLSGLLKMYERDTYRDDVITMYNNIELRLPFLDKNLADYSLKIPFKYKLNEHAKLILRQVAQDLGLKKEYAYRKKIAAQYGSKFDRALAKLAKKNNFQSKSSYLNQFYNPPNLNLGVLFSSGKDSTYAAYVMKQQNYNLSCLITIKSQNPDSYMFHTPAIDLADLQAKSMNLPLVIGKTKGNKEEELKDLEKTIKKAKQLYNLDGIITGALYSNYQRERIENICDKLGLKIFSPLWHIDQVDYMKLLLKNKFKIMITSVAAEGLDEKHVGKIIDGSLLDYLIKLKDKIGLNVSGEGGEMETLVLNCPLFKKELKINSYKIEKDNSSARILIKKASI